MTAAPRRPPGGLPAARRVVRRLEASTVKWLGDLPPSIPPPLPSPAPSFMQTAVELHRRNFFQWDREASVRAPDLSPEAVMTVKREIDTSNDQRSALIEMLDAISVRILPAPTSNDLSVLYVNSDTIGQLVDKLSVLTLKVLFTSAVIDGQGGRDASDPAALHIASELEGQREYLSVCYERFAWKLARGGAAMATRRQFKIYEHHGFLHG
jgi:Protein of unknown function (DUF4254)